MEASADSGNLMEEIMEVLVFLTAAGLIRSGIAHSPEIIQALAELLKVILNR
jgi:hypothetical protein